MGKSAREEPMRSLHLFLDISFSSIQYALRLEPLFHFSQHMPYWSNVEYYIRAYEVLKIVS